MLDRCVQLTYCAANGAVRLPDKGKDGNQNPYRRDVVPRVPSAHDAHPSSNVDARSKRLHSVSSEGVMREILF
jgi:hypothetical protein